MSVQSSYLPIYKVTTYKFTNDVSEGRSKMKCNKIFGAILFLTIIGGFFTFYTIKIANEGTKIENSTTKMETTELNFTATEMLLNSTEKNQISPNLTEKNQILIANSLADATTSLTVETTSIIQPTTPKIIENSLYYHPNTPNSDKYPDYDDINPPADIPEEFENHKNFKLFNQKECGPMYVGKRMQYGKKADQFEFPWMVALFIQNLITKETNFGCGGSLIAENLILTAAHCVATSDSSKL